MRYLLLLLLLGLCSGTASAQLIKVLKGGDMYDGLGGGGPISGLPGEVYWVQGSIRVPKGKKLTLRKVTFKFNNGTRLTVDGAIHADGYFTSIHDDKIVGDTNFNGNATVPRPGIWPGIQFRNGAAGKSLMAGVVRYAGTSTAGAVDTRSVSTSAAALDLTFSNFSVIDSGGPGIALGSVRPVLYRTNIVGAGAHAIEGTWPNLDRVSECRAMQCKGGDFILRRGTNGNLWPTTSPDRHFKKSQTLNQSGVFVGADNFVIPQFAKVSFEPGSVIKMADRARIAVQGDLELKGTSANKIVVTSIHDDTIGGDTNKNGSTTNPTAGTWGAIEGQARAGKFTTLEHVEVRYAGGFISSGIYNSARDLRMVNVLVRDIRGNAVRFVSNSTRGDHIVRDCRFERVSDLIFYRVPFDSLANFRGNVHGPGTKRAYSVEGLARRSSRVGLDSVPERVIHLISPLTPVANSITTIGPGMVVKCQSASLNGNVGRLDILGTPSAPVVLTSIHDDSALGDTNGNGSATKPAVGNWTGVRYSRDTVSTIEYAFVRYAGDGVSCTSKNTIVRCVRVDSCNRGFYFTAARAADNLMAHDCARGGMYVYVGSTAPRIDVRHATFAFNKGPGVDQGSGSSSNWRILNSIVWGNTGGNFGTRVTAASVHSTCGGFAGQNGNLNVDPRIASPLTLGLQTNSPCINAANAGWSQPVAVDFRGRSRISDWDYSGAAKPDMGAVELVQASMDNDKPFGPKVGETVTFNCRTISAANNGVAAYFLGFEDLRVFIAPWGMLNAGFTTLLPIATVTTPVKVPLPVPNDAKLRGIQFAVQALHIPLAKPSTGNFTNLYRARIR